MGSGVWGRVDVTESTRSTARISSGDMFKLTHMVSGKQSDGKPSLTLCLMLPGVTMATSATGVQSESSIISPNSTHQSFKAPSRAQVAG